MIIVVIYKTVSLKTNCNGFVEFCKPNCESHEAAEMEISNEKLKYMFKNSVEICQTGKQPSAEEKNKKLMIACGPSRVVGMVDEVLAAAKIIRPSKRFFLEKIFGSFLCSNFALAMHK